MDRISSQYAPNANETKERFTRTIRKTLYTRTNEMKRTNYTENANE